MKNQTRTELNALTWHMEDVARDRIKYDPHFTARQGELERAHVRTLMGAPRNGRPLTPVKLWKDPASDGGKLTVLDGLHRVAAYDAAEWAGAIPAEVIACDRRSALLIAAEANSKDTLSLTYPEKADMAWRLVREPGAKYSRREVVEAVGVSDGTVSNMRRRWKKMEAEGKEPTGNWRRDRIETDTEWNPDAELMEAERAARLADLAKRLQEAVGSWIFRDEQLVADALDRAFGYKFRTMADYAFGEVDEWAAMMAATSPECINTDEEDLPF